MFIQIGFDPGFQVLECGFHAGVSVLAFVDGAALVVGADKGGNHVILPNFDSTSIFDKAVNGWVLGFKCFGFWHWCFLCDHVYFQSFNNA
jgi:hypothetical protein